MKRQRGRGRNKPGGGGGGNQHHGNRSLESNGPDVKIRGTAAQVYEKYMQYARDAQSGGDRVKYENYLQHAEHYYRVMAATMPRERLLQQQNGEGGFGQGQQAMGEGGNPQASEGGAPEGETSDPMKVVDDGAGEADDGDDEAEAASEESGEEVQAQSEDEGENAQGQEGGNGRGRRRRGRRRHNDGDRPSREGGGDTEARSALDSLARKQGALTGG